MKKYIIIALGILIGTSCSNKVKPDIEVYTVDKSLVLQGKKLYLHLLSMSGHSTMFGHQDAGLYGKGWTDISGKSDVKDVCGSHPAVYGWELGHLELGAPVSLDSVSFDKIRKGIQETYRQGGINTISWHLRNPWNQKSAWDKTPGTVHAILNNETVGNTYKSWLDKLSNFALSLTDSKGQLIPVLFRPFHEHTGSWFWWGKENCSADDYKALWKLTVSYLRDTKGVHNLLYIYSPDRVVSLKDYLERYPGDEWVDIWGLDLYHRSGSDKTAEYSNTATETLEFMKRESKLRQKPFVFSETGLCTLNMDNWFTNVLYKVIKATHPAYVLVWRNAYNMPEHYFAPYPGHASCADFIRFKELPDVQFLDELTTMYQ